MIELRINNQVADIDSTTSFPLTFKGENLTNPTAVEFSFSKTVSLPATDRNSAIFEHIWRLDHKVMNFDPSKRVPFELLWNGGIIESGYIKLNSIEYSDFYPNSYSITMYGGLGSFFYSLSEKNLEDLEFDAGTFNHTINREAVVNSWTNDYYKYMLSYSGTYNNFETNNIDGITTYQGYRDVKPTYYGFLAVGEHVVATSADGINFYAQKQGAKYSFNCVHPNLVYSRTMAPTDTTRYIYLGAYVHGLSKDGGVNYYPSPFNYYINALTYGNNGEFVGVGMNNTIIFSYTGDLDSWYEAKINSTADMSGVEWSDVTWLADAGVFVAVSRQGHIAYSPSGELWDIVQTGVGELLCCASGFANYYTGTGSATAYPTVFFGGVNVWGRISFTTAGAVYYYSRAVSAYTMRGLTYYGTVGSITGHACVAVGDDFVARMMVLPTLSTSLTDLMYLGDVDTSTNEYRAVTYSNALSTYVAVGAETHTYSTDAITWTSGDDVVEAVDIPDLDEHQRNEFRSYYQRPAIRVKHLFNQIIADSGFNVVLDDAFFNSNNPYWEKTWVVMDRLTMDTNDLPESHSGNVRSGDSITYDLMIKHGVSQLNFLLYYCRTFGLLFDINELDGTVTIESRNTFNSRYQIEDWTDKVDFSKSFSIEPRTFDFKYGMFAWSEGSTIYETEYANGYNVDYGSTRVNTGYEFSVSENDLLKNSVFYNGVMSQEYDYNFEGRSESAYLDDKILPAFFTKSDDIRDEVSVNMVLLFDNGMQETNPFSITDDTPEMVEAKKYYWTNYAVARYSSAPYMTRLYTDDTGVYSLDFGKPNKIYFTGVTDENYPESATLYSRYWKRYVEELYDVDNKKLTVHFYLSPSDISQFDFNKFVRIKDTLWRVVKINDWDMSKQASTKVELVRVKDIDAYINGQNI